MPMEIDPTTATTAVALGYGIIRVLEGGLKFGTAMVKARFNGGKEKERPTTGSIDGPSASAQLGKMCVKFDVLINRVEEGNDLHRENATALALLLDRSPRTIPREQTGG